MNELEQFLAERNEALRTLDIGYARRMLPQATCDEVLLVAMHKARYNCTQIEDALRRESARWLVANGYRDISGLAIDPEGVLPI